MLIKLFIFVNFNLKGRHHNIIVVFDFFLELTDDLEMQLTVPSSTLSFLKLSDSGFECRVSLGEIIQLCFVTDNFIH